MILIFKKYIVFLFCDHLVSDRTIYLLTYFFHSYIFSIKGASLLKSFKHTPNLCIIKMHTSVQISSLKQNELIKRTKATSLWNNSPSPLS
jgi:hypothetical protein